ncbi:hypothetical protein [Methanocella sp. MCL-LM]|uniref:hypothetical protein n=1 Tax=Methanocella sp. MCL-LM TaxID=3412035 RepID=UPI003C72C22E
MANLQKYVLTAIIIITVIVALSAGTYYLFLKPGEALSPEQTAIDIALNTPASKEAASQYGQFEPGVVVGNVTPSSESQLSGYINASGVLLEVPATYGGWAVGENLVFTVDVQSKQIMCREQYFRRTFPATATAIVPPGASWYHRVYGAQGLHGADTYTYKADFTYEPRNASVYQQVMSGEELSHYRNRTESRAIEYTGARDNGTVSAPGSLAVNKSIHSSGQRISSGTGPLPEALYLVIENRDSEPVTVSYQALM